MYDAQTTRDTIEAAVRALSAKGIVWEPVYYSRRQIDHRVAHLDALYDPESERMIRDFNREEVAFIENERRLCALDFHYWADRYAKIIDWRREEVRFEPNVAQRIILDIWADTERESKAIMMQQLKARQLGVTTLTELAVAHRVQFRKRTNAVVASADPDKTAKMAKMIGYCWSHQPYWLLPRVTRVHQGMPAEFAEINSALLFQAGNQFTGLARGDTPNVLHASELCEWPDPENQIDASVLRAVHETPEVFFILESTALGRGNWWHNTWKQVKEDYPMGRSRLRPVFLPWYVGTDIWPSPIDLRNRPIPANWVPSSHTVHHAERAREFVLGDPLMFKHLAKGNHDWQMPREQMWFYEIERQTAIKKKQLNHFLSEMPANDHEAFQSSNISAVPTEVTSEYREQVRHPIAVYAITGPGIPAELTPPKREWVVNDPERPILKIDCSTVCRRATEVYHFVPVEFHTYNAWDPSLKLLVWEMPQDDESYGVGIDTSEGVGQDSSVIEVLRRSSTTRYDEQVAEFASAYVKAQHLWPMALAISAFYSTFSRRLAKRKQAKVAVECRGNGETVQFEMQKRGWTNFHLWKRYDNKAPTTDAQAHKFGIYTNSWFRSLMMDMLLAAFDDRTLIVNSPYLVDEMEALERDETRQSLKAVHGEHDDRVMGTGFALFTLHVESSPRDQFQRPQPRLVDPDAVAPVYAAWRPSAQGVDVFRPPAIPVRRTREGRMFLPQVRPTQLLQRRLR